MSSVSMFVENLERSRPPRAPWWRAAFGAQYPLVYARRAEREARQEIESLLALGLCGPVLDLGAGDGRHLAELARRGLLAVGVELSSARLAASRGERAGLVRADWGRLPLREGAARWALSMFSSFGYGDEEADALQLAEVWRVLAPDGRLVLDLADAQRVRAGLVPASERRVAGWRVRERRRLVEGGRRVLKAVRLRGPAGARVGWWESLRLRSPTELEGLLQGAGFELQALYGDWRRTPWRAGSERMIAVAGRYTPPSHAPRQHP